MGAYIGGHVVFKYGYMVNRNAFARGKKAKEFTPILAAAELPEATPTKAMLRRNRRSSWCAAVTWSAP